MTETLGFGDVSVDIVPERGALVTALRVGARDVLYLDRATLDDPAKNVRGGIPLLFPFAGKLVDDTFTLTRTKMKQHGFARNRAWTVTARDPASIQMTLAADAETRAQFPYDFTAHHRVMVVPNGVQLELVVIAGAAPVPVSPGWHPYFACATEAKASVHDGFTDEREFDFGTAAPIDGHSQFANGIMLDASPELRHLQFWSLPGKPFVCLEPFYGPAGTINTDQRGWVPAGQARTFWLRLRATA